MVVYFRVMEGTLTLDQRVRMMASGAEYGLVEIGHLLPTKLEPCKSLSAGEVGYLTASIKNVKDTQVGDTITTVDNPAAEPLPGYRPARSMVYCGIYTEDGSKYPDLRDALEKLQLNDASLTFEPETSAALGFGFRCGFLGSSIWRSIQERLDRARFLQWGEEDPLLPGIPQREAAQYIQDVVRGVAEHGPELDQYIAQYAKNWNFARIPLPAAAIMRVAMYEILYRPDIPAAASINDAVEIAKKYEDEKIVSFINGILGAFVRAEFPDTPAKPAPEEA